VGLHYRGFQETGSANKRLTDPKRLKKEKNGVQLSKSG
jgi:hypothetical protein